MIIEPIKKRFNKVMNMPGSKSLTVRALLLASIAFGRSKIHNVLESDDTNDCLFALKCLGINIEKQGDDACVVDGCGGDFKIKNNINIFVGNSGITARFLLGIIVGVLARSHKEISIVMDCGAQMKNRTIKPLVDSLLNIGAKIEYLEKDGFFPLLVKSNQLNPSKICVSGAISSQYVSSVLMMAPLLNNDVNIEVTDIDAENHPYIKMALKTMNDFGVDYLEISKNHYKISPQSYKFTDFIVETDFNTANYFFSIAAVANSQVEIVNLNKNTLQPGILFLDVLAKMGCDVKYNANSITLIGPKKLKGGFKVDMFEMAEMATTLAVLAVFADAPIEITGISHIRNHESDRIKAIATELKLAGIDVVEFDDGLIVNPNIPNRTSADTYDDHRIAMSLAILGLGANGIELKNPSCVSKTCPDFFDYVSMLL